MQWLAAVCVRRPVFTWVLMLALIVVGSFSMLGLGVDRFPNIDFPVVIVTTVLPGAAPEQMESEVSDKIEDALNSISGVDELRSNNFEGLSVVVARFDLDKPVAIAAQEVRDRVNRTLSVLPQGILQPRVERIDPDAAPVMLVALSGPRSVRELTEFASRNVRRQIESLSGVGGVVIYGGRSRQVNVTIDPVRLQAYGLTISDVSRMLAAQNIEVPGGTVYRGARQYSLRVQGRVPSIADFNNIALTSRNGLTVRLRDVGAVEDGEADASSIASLSGREVVILAPRKQSGTNTVAVIDGLKERINEIRRSLPPGFRLDVVRDEGEFIRNAINAVEEHLILGSLFAAIVVLLFLWNLRSTVISALAIPTSIIATFGLIKAMGLTLNTITLLGLTLAVGIVIDDAIVVLENIVKFVEEKGLNPRKAAIVATKEIGLAVLATTLSLIAVFLPVAFMGGIVGRFMASFGFTMSFAIVISLVVSFTLTPMLASRWLTARKGAVEAYHEEVEEADDAERVDPAQLADDEQLERYRAWLASDGGLARVFAPLRHWFFGERQVAGRWIEGQELSQWTAGERTIPREYQGAHGPSRGLYGLIERGYMQLLGFSMRHRWVIGMAMILAMASLGPLMKVVAKNFLPIEDESRFEVNLRAPEGTSLRQTALISERMARAIRQIPGVSHTVVTVGSAQGDASGRGSNQASLYVALVGPTQRTQDQGALIAKVRNEILPRFAADNLRVLLAPVNAFGGGGADNAGIQFVLRGPDLDRLGQYATALLERIRTVPMTTDHDSTLVIGKPELIVSIDRARAADLNVLPVEVANALRLLVGDVQITTFNEGGEQYEVHIRGNELVRERIDALSLVTVASTIPGRTVRLSDVVNVREASGPSVIQRLGRQRQVTVYCNVMPGGSEAAVIERIETAWREIRPAPGFSGELAGRSKELGKASKSFGLAFALSLIFMYLVLAAQFESWIHPVTILLSLPLTVPFAILSLVIMRQSINIFSALGILVLFGIVKKNSILQVDHMRALRRRGLSRADAVMIGNRDRLRPILMTTMAFVAGMVPLVVSSGAGAGTNRAMGSVIMGGQTLALLLTLLATPVLFTWFDDLSHSLMRSRVGRWISWPFAMLDRAFRSKDDDSH
ncbi:MAG: efflux RND transporter permease subunit [Deltaproteobacteria bacterium]|nr:efflux RND transporter permease subunit [Deltaproteobacteria bacterium]